MAIKALQLKQIWWLVSTYNPLKGDSHSNTLIKRLEKIKTTNKNYKVKPMAIELNLKTTYSYDTIKALKKKFPAVNFFWIIGADNLFIMHKWYNWKKLFYLCPVVVFDRPKYFYKSINSKAAKYFERNRINVRQLKVAKNIDLPKWSYLKIRLNHNSSSLIRNKRL